MRGTNRDIQENRHIDQNKDIRLGGADDNQDYVRVEGKFVDSKTLATE